MPFDQFNPPWLQQMLDIQRQLDRFGQPYSRFQEQAQLLDSIAATAGLQIGQSWRVQSSELLSALDRYQEISDLSSQIVGSLDSVSALGRELQSLSNSAYFSSVIRWQEELQQLQSNIGLLREMETLASDRVRSVLATVEASRTVLALPDSFADIALGLTEQYQSFAAAQFKKLDTDSDSVAWRRLEVTDLCGDLFETASASLEIGAAIDEDGREEDREHHEESPEFRARSPRKLDQQSLYSHTAQHLGFVYRESFEGDVEASFNGALPPRIVLLGYAIVEHLYTINSLAELQSDQQIIKPTNKAMRACAAISSKVASTEMEFRSIVDDLYFLLYEGSGSGKRLVDLVTDAVLTPLWRIKHLRLDSRHDIDHGKRSEIAKKRANIAQAYQSLVGMAFPARPGDWQRAQLALFEQVEEMLRRVVDTLAAAEDDS